MAETRHQAMVHLCAQLRYLIASIECNGCRREAVRECHQRIDPDGPQTLAELKDWRHDANPPATDR